MDPVPDVADDERDDGLGCLAMVAAGLVCLAVWAFAVWGFGWLLGRL